MTDDRPLPAADGPAPISASRLAGLAQPRASIDVARRSWPRWAAALLLIAFVGFPVWWHIVRPAQQNLHLRLSLASFGLLYAAYQQDYGRSPRNIDEFEEFVRSQSQGRRAKECEMARTAMEMARNGRLEVIWNAWRIWGSSGEYLARESKTASQGGFVLWINGIAEYFSADAYMRRPPRAIQTQDK